MLLGGLFGGFYRLTEWVTRIAVINLLWFFCSIPFMILIGLSLISPQASLAFGMAFLALLLLPITLFPATSAMFAVVRKWVNGDTEVSLFKGYFKAYIDNYKQSILSGLIYSLVFGIIIFNIRFYSELDGSLPSIMNIVFLVFFVIAFVTMLNFFSSMVHVRLKTKKIFKNAVLLTIVKPGHTLLQILALIIVGAVTYRFPGILLFFSGSVFAVVSFFLFNRMYSSIFDNQEDESPLVNN